MNILERITVNSEVCNGKPSIRNTRYTVQLILELLSAGMSESEIIEDYPALQQEDIRACLAYAAKLSEMKVVHKILA